MSGFLSRPLEWQCSEGWAGRSRRESDSRLNSKCYMHCALEYVIFFPNFNISFLLLFNYY